MIEALVLREGMGCGTEMVNKRLYLYIMYGINLNYCPEGFFC